MESFVKVIGHEDEKNVAVIDGEINGATLKSTFLIHQNAIFRLSQIDEQNEAVSLPCRYDQDDQIFKLLSGWDKSSTKFLAEWKASPASTVITSDNIGDLHSSAFDQNPAELTITDNLPEVVNRRCKRYLYFSKVIGIHDDGTYITALYDEGEDCKFLITVFTNNYAVTTLQCLRKMKSGPGIRDALENDEFIIYSVVNPEKFLTVKVVKLISTMDIAILQTLSHETFSWHPVVRQPEIGMRAVILGFPSFEDIENKNVVERQIDAQYPSPYPVEICSLNVPRATMFAATCGRAPGFSGAGLFRVYDKTDFLLGICSRGRIRPKEWLIEYSKESWLHRRSLSYYILSSSIQPFIDELEAGPAAKKLKF